MSWKRNLNQVKGATYPQKIFAHQLITVDDLNQFKQELLTELLNALKTQSGVIPKKWLKSQLPELCPEQKPHTKIGEGQFGLNN